ncbi:MAG: BrnA antitoxin family protein [Pseudomonadota bacterium]
MSTMDKKITRLNIDEIRQQKSLTDWERVRTMDDAEITAAALSDPDALPLDDAFFAVAKRMPPSQLVRATKPQITLRIDADILAWYKSLGKGYQSKMNAVLKAYAQTHAENNAERSL